MKHIYDALSIFLIEECQQRLPLPSGTPDLKAIARSASVTDTISLLKLVVIAAINCGDRIDYLEKMQTLTESTQEILMATAQEASEGGSEDEELQDDPGKDVGALQSPRKGATGIDTELESEERLGKVIADNQRIAHEKRDLQYQLDELQQRFATLQRTHENSLEELRETNERLTAVLFGTGDKGGKTLLDVGQESIIVSLEEQLLAANEGLEDLRRNNEILKIKTDKVQKLQDDLDEMRVDRDKLSRKANAAEKYKQKLETVQVLERENTDLKNKVHELQHQLKQSDTSQMSSSDLAREVDEYKKLLPSIEQDRFELNEMKKRLEFDYHTLEARYQDTLDQYDRQRKETEDLQSRLRDYEDGITPTPETPKRSEAADLGSLEADFASNEAKITEVLLDDEDETGSQISEDELLAIMSAMRAQVQVDSASERGLGQKIEQKLVGAIKRSYERQSLLKSHIQKQADLIQNLQRIPQEEPLQADHNETEALSAPTVQSRAFQPPPLENITLFPSDTNFEDVVALNDNLRRELRLMTGAWYAQHTRLLNSGMSISRRSRPVHSGAKSLLGKQRRVVDMVMLGA